jgi:acetyl-CoA synthetase
MAGDAAVMAEDGYVRILGRIDDVINVSGHRLGTKEIESAALSAEEVAEAAVVAVTDEIKGTVPDLYVSLKPEFDPSDDLAKKVSDTVSSVLGKIAKPAHVYIVPDMPKTRSGKIMRRILASISTNQDVGDVSTLANPQVVEEIRQQVQSG